MTPSYLWPVESRATSLTEEPPYKKARRLSGPDESAKLAPSQDKEDSIMTQWFDTATQKKSNTAAKLALFKTTQSLTEELKTKGIREHPKHLTWTNCVIHDTAAPIIQRPSDWKALSIWLAQNTCSAPSEKAKLEGAIPTLENFFQTVNSLIEYPSVYLNLLQSLKPYGREPNHIFKSNAIIQLAKKIHTELNQNSRSIFLGCRNDEKMLKKIQNSIISHLDQGSKISLRLTSKDSYRWVTLALIDLIKSSHLDLKFKQDPIQSRLEFFREYSHRVQVIDMGAHLLSDSLYRQLVQNFPKIQTLIAKIRKLPQDGFRSLEQLEALTMVVDEDTEYHNLAAPKLKYLQIVGSPKISISSIQNTLNCSSVYFQNSAQIHQVNQFGESIFDGRATLILPNQIKYQGFFRNSKPNGFCNVSFYLSGHLYKYAGNVTHFSLNTNHLRDKRGNKIPDTCQITFENGAVFKGFYEDGRPSGRGSIQFPDGGTFIGEVDGFLNCKGSYYSTKTGKIEGLFSLDPIGNIRLELHHEVVR